MARSRRDGQEVVQDACLRAFKYFDPFAGDNPSAWLLSIVRRACYTWMKRNRRPEELVGLEDDAAESEIEDPALLMSSHCLARDPEALLVEARQSKRLQQLTAALPLESRDSLIL